VLLLRVVLLFRECVVGGGDGDAVVVVSCVDVGVVGDVVCVVGVVVVVVGCVRVVVDGGGCCDVVYGIGTCYVVVYAVVTICVGGVGVGGVAGVVVVDGVARGVVFCWVGRVDVVDCVVGIGCGVVVINGGVVVGVVVIVCFLWCCCWR